MSGSTSKLIAARLGGDLYAKRIKRQTDRLTKFIHQGQGIFCIERILPFHAPLLFLLKILGLEKKWRRHFLDVRIERHEWHFHSLPKSFDGFRILQITDLHYDLSPDLAPVVEGLVRGVPHDAAVLTGDFRNGMGGCHEECVRLTARLAPLLSTNRWAVLGNHDFLEMAADLENAGIPVLLNESVEIRRGSSSIWIAGIDDPHYYQTHDIARARSAMPYGAFGILLSHSPETAAEAAEQGFSLQLSGHTHGGQICLPGGRHVAVPCKVPRPLIAGRWRHGTLHGYTSRGTGACSVAARWNCPPEITLHTLRHA